LIACLKFRDPEHPQGVVRLNELHLQSNNLTTKCLQKLSIVVRLSEGDLRELDLSANKIAITVSEDIHIWETFLEAFKGCYVLKKLDFSQNTLGSRGIEILTRVYVQSDLDYFVETPDDLSYEDPEDRIAALQLDSGKENSKPMGSARAGTGKKQSARQSEFIFIQPSYREYVLTIVVP